jgi:shikimate kinase
MIVVIFGLAAAGKTHVGRILSANFDFHHQDADEWLTEEMHQFIIDKKLFTLEMLDNFTNIIINNIKRLNKIHPNIIITQALYRQKNRNQIAQYFLDKPILFIQIDVADQIIHQRLIDRGGLVTSDYASDMYKFFEADSNARLIENNLYGKEQIIKQFKNIMSEIK